MRVAISNIAWDSAEDDVVAAVLARHGIDAIDVAPGKYFPDPEAATAEDISGVRQAWRARGMEITGLQGLLFGVAGVNLFGDVSSREAMLRRLGAVCRIGGELGARWLVFGSPRNRDRSGLADSQVREAAVSFFRRLGDQAAAHAVIVCLEANPPRYGCNFMTTTGEAAEVVRAVDHPAIRLHLDTGTLAINGEPADETIAKHADIIAFVHASEPDLVTLGDGGAPHAEAAAALARLLPRCVVSIEMLPSKAEPHAAAVERAVVLARRVYGHDASGGAAR